MYEVWERLKGYTISCPHHGVSMESLLGDFHRGVHEKTYIALNMVSNVSFASLKMEKEEQLVENLAQIDQCYGGDYDRTLREPRGDDIRFKEINDKLDKFIHSAQKAIQYVGEDLEVFQE